MLPCGRLNGVGSAFIKTLRVYNPRYDVLMIDLDVDFPQVDWFVANALFFLPKIEKIVPKTRCCAT